MSDDTERLRDAAYATGIPTDWPHAVAGYYGGPGAYHIWPHGDWLRFRRNKKLPIWVAPQGNKSGHDEGQAAVQALKALGVPKRVWTVLDMETMEDAPYVDAFGRELAAAKYKVWVYGSAGSVFANPPLDGYWVADYAGRGPFMYQQKGAEVRATQYASGQDWDSSTVKDFTWLKRSRWWI